MIYSEPIKIETLDGRTNAYVRQPDGRKIARAWMRRAAPTIARLNKHRDELAATPSPLVDYQTIMEFLSVIDFYIAQVSRYGKAPIDDFRPVER